MTRKLVRENMSTHLITIGWDEKMETAYRRMQSSHIRHLPVTNHLGEIVGMLSDRDVQRSMVSQVEHPSGRYASDETLSFDEDSRVRDYMSWPAKSVEQNMDLRAVAERMVVEKVSSLLVCDGNRTVGIVTVEDMLQVLIDLLSSAPPSNRWTLNEVLPNTLRDLSTTVT